MKSAIEREKRLKEWKRKWKLELIESAIRIGLFNWISAFAWEDATTRSALMD